MNPTTARFLGILATFLTLTTCIGKSAKPPREVLVREARIAESQRWLKWQVSNAFVLGTEQQFATLISGSGQADLAHNHTKFSFDVRSRQEGPESKESVRSCETLGTQDSFYSRIPDDYLGQFDGKRWTRVVHKQTRDHLALAGPATFLELLESLDSDLRKVRVVNEAGVTLTRYSGTIPLEKFTVQERKRTQQVIEGLEQLGLKRLRIDLWIDEDHLPRELRIAGKGETLDADFSADVNVRFFDYGIPVEIVAPTAEAVLEVDEEQASAVSAACLGNYLASLVD